jgi:hypothetical protein
MAMKRSKNFMPSGLDEVFESMMKHKQEAIAKGWFKDGVVQTQFIINSLPPKPETKPEKKSEGRA